MIFSLFDPFFTVSLTGLVGISLFLIGSTTPNLLGPQIIFFAFGLILLFVFAAIEIRVWRKLTWVLYFAAIGLLAVSFLGPNVRGATRWVEFWGLRLQPSELVKPFLILFFAQMMSSIKPHNFTSILKLLLLFFPPILLIFKQPDFGNVLVYVAFFLTMMTYGGLSLRFLVITVAGLIASSPFVWLVFKDYQRQRIISFLNPSADPIGAGYNALQAMIAIGSGKLWGLGLGRGTQSRLLFLPEYHTDFVFAALGEELGFFGGSLIILFYLLLLTKILRLSFFLSDSFEKFVTIGVFAQIFIQVFINIGMNLGLLPITGITLPFVSYGGSSILSTFIDLGLIFAIIRSRKESPLVIR